MIRTEAGVDVPVFEAQYFQHDSFLTTKWKILEMLVLEENGERIRLHKYPGLKVGSVKEANNNVG